MKLTTAQQMRELDRKAIQERGIPSIDLMERAAEGVARAALSALREKPARCRAAVFCGAGNNGGDGIAAARLLFLEGVRVRVFLVGSYEKLTPDALEETRRLSECGVELEPYDPEDLGQRAWARGSQVLIDAIFGVGLSRPIAPESPFGAAIALMNDCPGAVVAADIPSGVEADTGCVLGCAVRASQTVTFSEQKRGLAVGDGALCAGEVTVWDIGIPAELRRALVCPVQTVERPFVREALPRRRADGHKGTFGKVLIAGGSEDYTGAPYLTAAAAERSGCGLVFLGVPATIWAVEAVKCAGPMAVALKTKLGSSTLDQRSLPDILARMEACDVLALGPGMGRSRAVTELVCAVLREVKKPVVLDADGINALEGHIDVLKERRDRVTILTPHDGEFARIGGEVRHGDRLRAAQDFAAAHGCTVVLKGHRTVTAVPAGNALVNTTGNAGLAKGGSGDVLTGIIASLLAQGATPAQAAAAGVWLHGRAGDLAAARMSQYAMTPLDVIGALPEAFLELE